MTINRVPYSSSLRALGHILDRERARMVTICEIEQGFLLHYFPKNDASHVQAHALHSAETLDVDDSLAYSSSRGGKGRMLGGLLNRRDDLQKFLKTHPLLPMGYESLLHALGLKLDSRTAESIDFTETADAVHIDYTIPKADFVVRNGARMILDGRRSERYTRTQAEELIAQAETRVRERVQRATQQLSFNPHDASVHIELARALDDYGAHRDAEDMYGRATQLAPRQAEAYYQLASHARRRGDRKGGLKYLQQAVAMHGEDGKFLHLLGRLNIEADRLDAAVAALESAISVEPANPMYHYDLSRAYEKQGRADAARIALTGFDAQLTTAHLSPSNVASVAVAPASNAGGAYGQGRHSRLSLHQSQAEHETALSTQEPSATATATSATAADVAALQTFLSPSSVDFPVPTSAIYPPTGVNGEWPTFALEEQQWPRQDGVSPSATLPESAALTPDDLFSLRSTDMGHARFIQSQTAPAKRAVDKDPKPEMTSRLLPDAEASVRVDARTPADDEAQLLAAVTRAREMVLAEPGRADLHRRLGFLLAKQGHNEEAASEFRLAAEAGRRNLFV